MNFQYIAQIKETLSPSSLTRVLPLIPVFLGAQVGLAQTLPMVQPKAPAPTSGPVTAPSSSGVNSPVVPTAAPATIPEPTSFLCITADGQFATVARRGGRTTTPMITWVDTSFGSQFTPQRRCEIVSERLTRAVANNGGRLRNLRLTYGSVNGFPVICYVSTMDDNCNRENLLITLRQDDRGKEKEILQQIITFSVQGSGRGLTRGNFSINFGEQVDNALNGRPPAPASPTASPAPVPQSMPPVRLPAPTQPSPKVNDSSI